MLRNRNPSIDHELTTNININVYNWLQFVKAENLGFYMALRLEIDIGNGVKRWLENSQNHTAYLPICEGKSMRFAQWTPKTSMKLGLFGIREPICDKFGTPDVYLVPCVGMNTDGYRIGHGGGYYDRYFKKLRDLGIKFTTAGICEDFFITDAFKPEAHDIPLDYAITNIGIRDFSSNRQ